MTTTQPQLLSTAQEARAFSNSMRAQGQRVGFVPTMGALHDGHASLIRTLKAAGYVVVISIFVNPLQFGPNEDYSRYPRTLPADTLIAQEAGASAIFAPSVEEMYPAGFSTTMKAGPMADRLCGIQRVGHFDGVLTVVAKLFNMVQPDTAIFGEKDFQQLALIRQMGRDFNFPIEILGGEIRREMDGLAMSSRNVYLTPEDRAQAVCLSRAIAAAQNKAKELSAHSPQAVSAQAITVDTAPLLEAAHAALAASPRFVPEYVEIRDAVALESLESISVGSPATKHARIFIAGRFGVGTEKPVRLIDNGPIFL